MKSRVSLSIYSLILTVLVSVTLIVATFILLWNGEGKGYLVAVILLFMFISGLLYGPRSVSADENKVTVKSIMRKQYIPVSKILDVELFQPTMGSVRVFGSGGYMGHWGIFREGDVGKYVAYYGKSSDCFMLRMKNGDKYVLGCENPKEMVDFIKKQINQ